MRIHSCCSLPSADQWRGNFSALLICQTPSLVATVTGGNDTFGGADVYFY